MSLLALVTLSLLVSSTYFVQGDADSRDEQEAPDPDPASTVGPGFRVYGLKELSRSEESNHTHITFAEDILPFDFMNLVFGDYSTAPQIGETYYAGSGMILNVTGPSGNVTLREQGGKVIRTVLYQGRGSIVFNGETVFISAPKASTRYEGTDLLVQDWLNGTWSPEMGVLLERPTGMTIEKAELFLMVFQPMAPVPEFGAYPIAAIMVAAVCLIASRLRGRDSK